jgi:transcriptional regulator with XRE-family HTH domain
MLPDVADEPGAGTNTSSPPSEEFTVYARIGRRVQLLRKERGMTQAALASLVSLTRASIVNIERGRQKFLVHTLIQMARALGVSTTELLTETDVSSEPPLDALLRDRAPGAQAWIRSAMKDDQGKDARRNGRSKKANS